jgi:hypothetical protein
MPNSSTLELRQHTLRQKNFNQYGPGVARSQKEKLIKTFDCKFPSILLCVEEVGHAGEVADSQC